MSVNELGGSCGYVNLGYVSIGYVSLGFIVLTLSIVCNVCGTLEGCLSMN